VDIFKVHKSFSRKDSPKKQVREGLLISFGSGRDHGAWGGVRELEIGKKHDFIKGFEGPDR